jgi:hypothetical protein
MAARVYNQVFGNGDENVEYNFTIQEAIQLANTGDLLLMSGTSFTSSFVEFFTVSEWSHIAMVVRHPKINGGAPAIFEAIHSDDDRKTSKKERSGGVRLIDMEKYLIRYQGFKVAIKFLCAPNPLIYQYLNEHLNRIALSFVNKHNNKPYEYRWIKFIQVRFQFFDTSGVDDTQSKAFFCSELVSAFYIEAGLFNAKSITPSMMLPDDFDSSNTLTLCYPQSPDMLILTTHYQEFDKILRLSREYNIFIRPI